jgi:hypothetical protein
MNSTQKSIIWKNQNHKRNIRNLARNASLFLLRHHTARKSMNHVPRQAKNLQVFFRVADDASVWKLPDSRSKSNRHAGR